MASGEHSSRQGIQEVYAGPEVVNGTWKKPPMLPNLKLDADGGLTIYIQTASPGKGKKANWLPAPNGPFMLAMRYYFPKPELLEGKWQSQPVEPIK